MIVYGVMHRKSSVKEAVHEIDVLDVIADLIIQNASRFYQSRCKRETCLFFVASDLPRDIKIYGIATHMGVAA